MPETAKSAPLMSLKGWTLLLLGCLIVAFGWVVPSRFKSVPFGVARQAGAASQQLSDLAESRLLDGNLGSAATLADSARDLGEQRAIMIAARVAMEKESSPQVARWGAWDPFLEAALADVPLGVYSDQPGLLGILIAESSRVPTKALLENSRSPLVRDLLASGELSTYQRLFPVSSSSGRPLEITLLGLGLLAQGDHFSEGLRSDLRSVLAQAMATGSAGPLEDVYLDVLSLMRLFDWGRMKEVVGKVDSSRDLNRLRYLLHRRPDDQALVFAMLLASESPGRWLDYLSDYGDRGFDSLRAALASGIGGFRLIVREGLPLELADADLDASGLAPLQDKLASFALRNPQLSLTIKYSAFFVGSFLALLGGSRFGRFYRETITPSLAFTQRFFGATASVIVFAVLSEPYLVGSGGFEGYSFRFVLPVLAQVDGELQIVETTPTTTSMEPATLLSIAFFFFLQALVFLICLLKVREIERRELDPIVKLRLMENEENLFDSGLYVGIAGTCIALVMQVIGIVEANLLAAYSSNLFGILCVAIVKIRLVRPYKTKLIMASEDRLAQLAAK